MKIKLLVAAIAASALSFTPSTFAEVKVSTKGGLKVESEDYSFQFGGRIQYDYNRSELNGEVDEDAFDLRRGRVFVKGNVTDDWYFKVNYDVNDGGEQDLFLQYRGFGPTAYVTIGNQQQAFSMEQLISSKDVSISERTGITERFSIGRQESIVLSGVVDNFTYATSVFALESDTNEEDFGFSARTTYVPYKTDSSLVHLGASYKDSDPQTAFGLELAGVAGAAHFQAEYFDGEEGDDEEDIDGYYAQIGYFLTGEMRPYKNGTFKRPKPSNSYGAWELVARYEDGDGSYGDVELGNTDASAFSVGVNYYPSYNVRINASYMDGEDNVAQEDGSFNDGNEFRLRFQLTF